MSNSPPFVIVAAFTGALIWLGVAQANAAESGACRILAPRYELKARSPNTQPVRFPGGARLIRPVATPCPPSRRSVDA
jgi:hypothetical protein